MERASNSPVSSKYSLAIADRERIVESFYVRAADSSIQLLHALPLDCTQLVVFISELLAVEEPIIAASGEQLGCCRAFVSLAIVVLRFAGVGADELVVLLTPLVAARLTQSLTIIAVDCFEIIGAIVLGVHERLERQEVPPKVDFSAGWLASSLLRANAHFHIEHCLLLQMMAHNRTAVWRRVNLVF